MTDIISPIAGRVIAKCGGVAQTAKLCGRSPVSVHKWRHTREKGGTGGLVPTEAAQALMAAAQRGEVSLTAEDFFDLSEAAE